MKRGSSDSVTILLRNIPKPLLEKFDLAWKDEFSSRSEALRGLIRMYIDSRASGVDKNER